MNLLPIILIIASVVGFFGYVDPTYQRVKQENQIIAQSNEALALAGKLKDKKAQLANLVGAISQTDKDRLIKALPDNADSVRLAIDVLSIARNHGVTVRDVGVSDVKKAAVAVKQVSSSDSSDSSGATYGETSLGLKLSASYQNFLAFLNDVETSLRFADVNSIKFDSSDTGVYQFDISVTSYWLK